MISFPLVLLWCFLLLVVAFAGWNLYAMFVGAPFVPSTQKRIVAMRDIAQLSQRDVALDVGSGDGRLLRAVAPYVREALGIEINPVLVWYSRCVNVLFHHRNTRIVQGNFWTYNLADIDVLFVYCIHSKMELFEKKVVNEMKPGSRIVSNGFSLPNCMPVHTDGPVAVYVL